MRAAGVRFGCMAMALGVALAASPTWGQSSSGAKGDAKSASPAEALRKALDEKITVDYSSQSFQEAINHLRQKTKINFVLDMQSLQQMGIGFDEQPTPVLLKVDNGKVKTALQKMLSPYHLTYVILGDSVMITTEDMAHYRQMQQRVSVEVKDVPLASALKKLADETAVNLLIDPRMTKDAQAAVSLQLDDVSLETAVLLLTEIGGLKSVRVGNVLFVTSEERATKLRKEQQVPRDPRLGPPAFFGGTMTVPGFIGPNGANGVIPPRAAPDRPVRNDPPPAQDLPVRPETPPPPPLPRPDR